MTAGKAPDRRRSDQLALLAAELQRLRQASEHLVWSLDRCRPLVGRSSWTSDELERLESLASRFARLADLLTQRVGRLADALELESPGSLLDRIHRAEKRGWVATDGQLVRVRELRNLIAHEYEDAELADLYRELVAMSPVLIEAAARAVAWGATIR